MNLLILSTSFPNRRDPVSGVFVAEQANSLAQLLPTTVVAPLPVPLPFPKHRPERREKQAIPLVEDDGLRVYRPRFPDLPRFGTLLNPYGMLFSVVALLRRARLKPDLIHCHFAYPSGYVGVLLGKLWRCPVFITVHGYDVHARAMVPRVDGYRHLLPESATRELALVRRCTRYALRSCTRIVAVSGELASWVIRLGISPERISVVPNGVDLKRFYPLDRMQARRQLGLPADRKIVLYVGGLVERKGVEVLIESSAKLSDDKVPLVVIVGDGPLRGRIEEQARSLNIAGRVRFAGAQTHAQVPLWINAADALCLPTRYDTFGCVLLEAIACGRPVVSAKVGGIPEVVEHGRQGLLVPPGDSDLLAAALDDALHRTWDEEALVQYARGFSWVRIASQLVALYTQLAPDKLPGKVFA